MSESKKRLSLDEQIARKVLETVDAGLVNGLGNRKPGEMCVEAAVCYAYDLPHSDSPPCVGIAVRSFQIRMNDSHWSSDRARTDGMRALAIAQLGSESIDQCAFARLVSEGMIRRVVPTALRAAAKLAYEPHKTALENAAQRCEKECNAAAAAAAAAARYADAAARYAAAADDADAARDEVLNIAADVGLQALIELKSPGCEYLYLLKE